MTTDWQPDWRVHPGESLREAIEALGISQAEFARRIEVTPPFVSALLAGRKNIGTRLALKLEAAGVGSARFWLTLQMNHDLHLARERAEE